MRCSWRSAKCEDVPEGFATAANLRAQGVARRTRVLLGALFAVHLLGATLGYWGLRGRDPVWQIAVLAFGAGMLVIVAVEEMMREAHKAAEPWFGALAFTAGFVLFTFLGTYLE